MLNEICPKTNRRKRLCKREKEMGVGRHAPLTRALITQIGSLEGETKRIIQTI